MEKDEAHGADLALHVLQQGDDLLLLNRALRGAGVSNLGLDLLLALLASFLLGVLEALGGSLSLILRICSSSPPLSPLPPSPEECVGKDWRALRFCALEGPLGTSGAAGAAGSAAGWAATSSWSEV